MISQRPEETALLIENEEPMEGGRGSGGKILVSSDTINICILVYIIRTFVYQKALIPTLTVFFEFHNTQKQMQKVSFYLKKRF